jgi:hypothetical protein
MSSRVKAILVAFVFGVVLFWASEKLWDKVVDGNVDMDFYGRFVNRDGNGISEVKVSGIISRGSVYQAILYIARSRSSNSNEDFQVFSDPNGNFELHLHGREIQINDAARPGYEESYIGVFDYEHMGKSNTSFPNEPDKRAVYTLR